MIRVLIRKELLANLRTARLGLVAVLTVALTGLAVGMGSMEFSRNYTYYESRQRELSERRQEVTTWSQVQRATARVIIPPQPLGVLGRGLPGTAVQGAGFGVGRIPTMVWIDDQDYNRFLKVISEIDATMVIAVVLSFLAVILGFDGISGERERGTLKLLLANSVPRSHVVLAKLTGGVTSLWIPLALSYLVALVALLNNPDVVLEVDDWIRLSGMFLLSCLFLAQVLALSLMVSAFVRESSTSLVICLFAWLVGSVGYMNLLPSLSRYGVHERPSQEFRDGHARNREIFDGHMDGWDARHPAPAAAWLADVSRDGVRHFMHPEALTWRRDRHEFEIDKLLEFADAEYKWWPEALAEEARLIDRWAILSPVTNYQILSYMLARTTFGDAWKIGAATRHYRLTWIEYLRSRGAFSDRRWFTDDPVGQQPLIPDPAGVTPGMLDADSPFMQARHAWADEQLQRIDANNRSLDLSDMPPFTATDAQRDLGGTLATMLPGLLVLLLSFGTAVIITFTRFNRDEPY
ncbi:MAG TPA: ABC transporter permease [Candidatus Latescibacteria bacterium]|jgi:ABC-type transport system involved in multi-copper enzyme maturation permease subunit|nr:ABC transporter permease [Candidatus Latescibacterota bacterium]HJP33071.1 ABC transporter permease [Candidatus Latescibacterota bacterium]|tara:strand:- start:40 stop:1602 length:1563 start_codon:yes stop_codon:yes gene_type:complete